MRFNSNCSKGMAPQADSLLKPPFWAHIIKIENHMGWHMTAAFLK